MSINQSFNRDLSANCGLEGANAKEDSKVHVWLPLRVIDPDCDYDDR